MTDDTPTTTSGDKTITVLGALVTIAGFVLAWIVWTSAGEITGHTVAMIIPIIEFRFSVAFLLPVLSEGPCSGVGFSRIGDSRRHQYESFAEKGTRVDHSDHGPRRPGREYANGRASIRAMGRRGHHRLRSSRSALARLDATE